jgi:hypothetical protein
MSGSSTKTMPVKFVLRVAGDANGGGVTGDAHLIAPLEKRMAAIYFLA